MSSASVAIFHIIFCYFAAHRSHLIFPHFMESPDFFFHTKEGIRTFMALMPPSVMFQLVVSLAAYQIPAFAVSGCSKLSICFCVCGRSQRGSPQSSSASRRAIQRSEYYHRSSRWRSLHCRSAGSADCCLHCLHLPTASCSP